jgi:hypothetical protein
LKAFAQLSLGARRLKELVGCPFDAQAKSGQAIQDRWPGQAPTGRKSSTNRALKTARERSRVEPAQMAVPPELKKQWNACSNDANRRARVKR